MIVADSSFAALELLEAARQSVMVITRLRLDAALYEPAPEREPRQNGRPRLKGARRPTLKAVLKDAATKWTRQLVAGWYDGTERVVEVTSATGVWYHTGLPPVPVRWVVVRDPADGFKPQALLSTNLESDPVQMLAWFVRRWAVEIIFEEARALGDGDPKTVVGDSHCAHDSGGAGVVLGNDVVGTSATRPEKRIVRAASCVVHQAPADLLGCAGDAPATAVA